MAYVSKKKAQVALKKLSDRSVTEDKWIIVKEFFRTQSPYFQILEQNRVKFESFQAKVMFATNNLVRGLYTEDEFNGALQELLNVELSPIKEAIHAILENGKINSAQASIMGKLNDSIDSFESAVKESISGELYLVSDEEERAIQVMSEQAIMAGDKISVATKTLLSSIRWEPLVEMLGQVDRAKQQVNLYISQYLGNEKGMAFAWFNFDLDDFVSSDKLGLLEECYEEFTSSMDSGSFDEETISLLSTYRSMLVDYIQGLHEYKRRIKVLQDRE